MPAGAACNGPLSTRTVSVTCDAAQDAGTDTGDAGDAGVAVQEGRPQLKEPRKFVVLLHNDDYTTMEFVVALLMHVFHHGESEAQAIMLHIHRTGMGVAGVYTYEVAETKVQEVTRYAREHAMPLLVTAEPD